MSKSILIRQASSVLQVRAMPDSPLRGSELNHLPSREGASVLIENGIIARIIDATEQLPEADIEIDARDRLVLPCWCDSHTHLVYAASREGEFVDRINGLSYEEIAARGGGILNSARRLHSTSEDDLYESAWQRLQEVINYGTGAIEIKSGYGLNTADELKILRTIRRLKENSPIPIKATFLGAHAIPTEYKDNREGYVKLIINEMLPLIHSEGLADYIDVFCENGFFNSLETELILEAGARYGLRPKIHVNQLSNSGGVQVGIKHDALSVDHLEEIGREEIELLGKSDVIATLLPSCSFFINIPFAPARALIDANAAVAIASDYNPGSTPSGKIPFLISLASIKLRMTPAEAINAITINGAYAMGVQDECGVIAEGRPARLFITRPMQSVEFIPYAFGSDHIEKVVLPDEVRKIN
jgi:imidazolonepropionase